MPDSAPLTFSVGDMAYRRVFVNEKSEEHESREAGALTQRVQESSRPNFQLGFQSSRRPARFSGSPRLIREWKRAHYIARIPPQLFLSSFELTSDIISLHCTYLWRSVLALDHVVFSSYLDFTYYRRQFGAFALISLYTHHRDVSDQIHRGYVCGPIDIKLRHTKHLVQEIAI